jgi:hypothetical protein
MVYKQKVQSLLEALTGKIRIIENIANGTMQMDTMQVGQIIQETKKLTEQISEIVSVERD